MLVEKSYVKSSIPSLVENREKVFGRFTAKFAERLQPPINSTVFCGPASFRDPETDNCWHPYMIRGGFAFFIRDQIPLLIRALAGGILRFIKASFGRFYFIPNDDAKVLGFAPTNICKIERGRVVTAYCHPEDRDSMAWLLVDESKKEPEGYLITRTAIMYNFFKMLANWIFVTLCKREEEKDIDWAVASILTLRWIVSFLWVNKWILALKIQYTLKENRFKEVYCAHEMHPQTRIACIIADSLGVISNTVQHASINRHKLWYFPTSYELDAGLKCPDKFFVFSDEVLKLLRPYYPPSTSFVLGCSNRYAHWKNKKLDFSHRKGNLSILFATSLSWWDNVVTLKALGKLIENKYTDNGLSVRLHPSVQLPLKLQTWLKKMINEGYVVNSDGPLDKAITSSDLVVGMNTTLLEEAALLGKPILILQSSDYLTFATPIGPRCHVDSFSFHVIEKILNGNKHDDLNNMVVESRRLLGLDLPEARICKE